jgi:hypothetical protein
MAVAAMAIVVVMAVAAAEVAIAATVAVQAEVTRRAMVVRPTGLRIVANAAPTQAVRPHVPIQKEETGHRAANHGTRNKPVNPGRRKRGFSGLRRLREWERWR